MRWKFRLEGRFDGGNVLTVITTLEHGSYVLGDSTYPTIVGLCALGVTCSPRDPRFAGSNPAEVNGFFQDFKLGVPSLKFQAR